MAVLLLFPPAFSGRETSGEGPAAPRSDWSLGNSVEIELKDNGSVYTGAMLNVQVPANATVMTASIDLQGKMTPGNLTVRELDFSQHGVGHRAYKGQVLDFDRTTTVESLEQHVFESADYDAVSASDNRWVSQGGSMPENIDGYELFVFNATFEDYARIDIKWEGHVWRSSQASGMLWIWNGTSGSWDKIGTGIGSTDTVVSRSIKDYWYSADRTVIVLAMCTDGYDIYTDYVNVTAFGLTGSYPVDPSMDIGADGSVEWSLKEPKFNYSIGVSEPAVAQALQKMAAKSCTRYVNLNILFTSKSAGWIRVNRFDYTYAAPPWCIGIPDTFHLYEDTVSSESIDLDTFFSDDGPCLKYAVSFQQDSKKLRAELDADGHSLSFRTIARDWCGKLKFQVTATDSDNLATKSNYFTVTVDPVNDAPIVLPIDDKKVLQGRMLLFLVNARDADTDFDPNETLKFSDDTKLFDIDPADGCINYTARQADVGYYYVTITVTDRAGASGNRTFLLTVKDFSDPPVLGSIPDLVAIADEPFHYVVTATDPDLPFGDRLTFSDDTALFDIDAADGTISFTPRTGDIGAYLVTITVKDMQGKSDKKTVTFTVHNCLGTLDRPLVLSAIPDQIAVEGELFTYSVNAWDPDLTSGDHLIFKDNTGLFEIGLLNGTFGFTPISMNIGVHRISLTARDNDGLTATVEFNLTVLRRNDAPEITRLRPKDNSMVLLNHKIILSADARDPDGDRMSYTWTEGDVVIGTDCNIMVSFNTTGPHTITITVSDGRAQTVDNITLQVVRTLPANPHPDFGAAMLMLAISLAVAGAVAAGMMRGRRKKADKMI